MVVSDLSVVALAFLSFFRPFLDSQGVCRDDWVDEKGGG
jgi:hypothetical protein